MSLPANTLYHSSLIVSVAVRSILSFQMLKIILLACLEEKTVSVHLKLFVIVCVAPTSFRSLGKHSYCYESPL